MTNQIQTRNITKADYPQFAQVFAETVSTQFPEYDNRITDHFIHNVFPEQSQIEKIRIGAFNGNELVGYIIAENPFGGIVQVVWLSVRDQYQRQGLGKKLLDALQEAALSLGAHAIHIQADERNLPFYKKCGYEVLGFDKEGSFGTDNYLLKKNIAKPNIDSMLK